MFNKPQMEKLAQHASEIREACEVVEESLDNYEGAEDAEERDQARSEAYDGVQDIDRLVNDEDYQKLVSDLSQEV